MLVRRAVEQDVIKIITVMKDAEASGFMLYEPNERQPTPDSLSKFIKIMNTAPKSCFFVAEENEEILGYLLLKAENLSRTSHRATIAVGVHSLSRGKGTGTKLFEHMINWAKQQKLHRLELTVIEHNSQAVHLYKKMGFIEEGVKRDSLWIHDRFVNEIYMSLLL
ncbi:GNAT family N-acetyltransferase [Solibacillus sp. MA9]|uniref:GNAT family N-acetyltransferase n=1 Tax=Solibacillus palustris TaxID=2908203 RepID=A0ABS9UHC9_9BACL|nr:GNAT family N-acetyltransferase [Solibacillus sp. MA9]MCH7323764.1 GNAT family N-acetyltransferase [Solibacillus sp. MA9]